MLSFARGLIRLPRTCRTVFKQANFSSRKVFAVLAGVAAGACALYWTYSNNTAGAFGYIEECVHYPHYHWPHDKLWQSFDHAAIRRGFQVYNTIGSACHGLKYKYYRELVDVAYTEEEAKAIAGEHDDYLTLPNDEGEIEQRPGALTDAFWSPYKNDKEARMANNGALPPDLSQIVKARHGGENYIFALLTGYRDPPHGTILAENMYYNLYFPGCQIAMPPPLAPGAVTYEDGTDASVSQMAKDVSVFLTWTAYMEHDERHLMGLKVFACFALIIPPFWYWKAFRFSTVKKRHVEFLRRNKDYEPPKYS